MASKLVLTTALFDQFSSFVTELSEMYPDDPDFPLFLTTLRLLRATNPSMLAKYILENTAPYEDHILTKNEAFFLEHTFESHGDLNMDILAKLKGYVASMSSTSKESVWKYCQNILRLAKAVQ